jgi:ABC-type dipeptide/oligopeptide/nickel transport system ATPase component
MTAAAHDLELAEAACEGMVAMYAGRGVEELPVQG